MLISFENPMWLFGLLIIPVILVYNRHFSKRKSILALEFSKLSVVKAACADNLRKNQGFCRFLPLSVSGVVFALGLLAAVFIFTGLSNPMIPLEEVKDGVNLVFAIDVSGSMKASDYQPDRITAAKEASLNLINQLDSKDYVGIVTFDSGATTSAYLSPDKERVIEKLQNIEAGDGSTSIGDGLALATDMAVSIPGRDGIVVLLSDGESNSGYISPATASNYAKDKGVQVFTVAMGSNEPVLVSYDWANNPGYATVNEEALREISDNTGGVFYRSVDEKTLESIYKNIDNEIVRETQKTPVGWVFFIFAAILIFIEYLIRYGRWRIVI